MKISAPSLSGKGPSARFGWWRTGRDRVARGAADGSKEGCPKAPHRLAGAAEVLDSQASAVDDSGEVDVKNLAPFLPAVQERPALLDAGVQEAHVE